MFRTRTRRNCWDVMGCGRQPGGVNAATGGVCPAAVESRLDGLNRGVCGGRACWGVPGTNCREAVGKASSGFTRCLDCPFFQLVEREEGRHFEVMRAILARLKGADS